MAPPWAASCAAFALALALASAPGASGAAGTAASCPGAGGTQEDVALLQWYFYPPAPARVHPPAPPLGYPLAPAAVGYPLAPAPGHPPAPVAAPPVAENPPAPVAEHPPAPTGQPTAATANKNATGHVAPAKKTLAKKKPALKRTRKTTQKKSHIHHMSKAEKALKDEITQAITEEAEEYAGDLTDSADGSEDGVPADLTDNSGVLRFAGKVLEKTMSRVSDSLGDLNGQLSGPVSAGLDQLNVLGGLR